MPRFNFEVRTETHAMLTDGAELPDLRAARIEAARRIGELLTEHAAQVWVDQNWRMDVTDETGLILYVLNVIATKTPVTLNAS